MSKWGISRRGQWIYTDVPSLAALWLSSYLPIYVPVVLPIVSIVSVLFVGAHETSP